MLLARALPLGEPLVLLARALPLGEPLVLLARALPLEEPPVPKLQALPLVEPPVPKAVAHRPDRKEPPGLQRDWACLGPKKGSFSVHRPQQQSLLPPELFPPQASVPRRTHKTGFHPSLPHHTSDISSAHTLLAHIICIVVAPFDAATTPTAVYIVSASTRKTPVRPSGLAATIPKAFEKLKEGNGAKESEKLSKTKTGRRTTRAVSREYRAQTTGPCGRIEWAILDSNQ